MAAPTELRVSPDKRTLTISFEGGSKYALSAELLRVESPSAEVQGHNSSQKKTVPGKRNVEIMKIEPVGNYAVRITFDDMHDTGIYSWDTLRQMGEDADTLMKSYLAALESQGLER